MRWDEARREERTHSLSRTAPPCVELAQASASAGMLYIVRPVSDSVGPRLPTQQAQYTRLRKGPQEGAATAPPSLAPRRCRRRATQRAGSVCAGTPGMRGPHVPGSPGQRKEASSSRGTSLGTGAAGPTGRSPQPTLPGLPQGRSRFWAASPRSSLRRVLCGPAVLLAARWNETTRSGSAPARTTVWPPEQDKIRFLRHRSVVWSTSKRKTRDSFN
eukprot:XP_028352402.1 uncharacterized protein LOC114487282 [Physeter catodon]